MEWTRVTTAQAQFIAHVLDDLVHIPGLRRSFGVDPILGLIPPVGDLLAVLCGSTVLLAGRQIGCPMTTLVRMSYNQLLNGVVGVIPFVGDAFSFWFKSHSKNAALLVRTLKYEEDQSCALVSRSPTAVDVLIVLGLTLPIAAAVAVASYWLWERDLSVLSWFLLPPWHRPLSRQGPATP